MSLKSKKILEKLQTKFLQHKNPERAKEQQRYMKSSMPYYGLSLPEIRSFSRAIFKEHVPENNEEYRVFLRYIFEHATHREEWYAGTEYAKKFKCYQIEENIDLFLDIVRLTQWWDIVDEVAALDIGTALKGSKNLKKFLCAWIKDENLWVRRTALLTQLKYKQNTNFSLQQELITAVAHEKDFFIRKAIGWSLREYSKTNPQSIVRFIELHKNILSPLSIKEGLKVITRACDKQAV